MEFVDVHAHVLPEVDDGARSFEEAVRMVEEARDAGVRKILLTPHVSLEENPDVLDTLAAQYEKLKGMASVRASGVELHLGAELMMHPDLPDRVSVDKRLTVNAAGKFILFEMPMPEIPFYASAVCFRLLAKKVNLVWAHPERCSDVVGDYRVIKEFVDNGVFVQIDAASLTGVNGRRIRQTAETIIQKGLAHMLAGDVHRPGEYGTLLPEAVSRLKKLVGERKAEDMCVSAPTTVFTY